jgi:muramidase (phage lysozyme)
LASPYIRDYRHYNSAGTDPITIQRPNYQVGDIILVVYNSGNWSNSRQPSLSTHGFTQLNPWTGTGGEPFNLRVIFYKTATANEPSTYSIDVSSAYERTTVTIMTIANAEYAKVFNTQSYNTNLGSVTKDSLVIASLTTEGTPPNPNGGYSLLATGRTGTDSRQHPVYQKSYAANEQIKSASVSAAWNSTYMIYLVFTEKISNNAPTTPSSLTGAIQDTLHMTGESVTLNWGASTDQDGDAITYELEFTKDGSTWTSIQTGISATTFNHTFTNDDTDVGQFRVRAKDSKGGYSGYTLSPKFKTRRKLLLIKDGESFKTFKSGSWQII